jgi:hypothetical protein
MQHRILGLVTAAALVIGVVNPPVKGSWGAEMNGRAETPANTSGGTGTATFTLVGNSLEYVVTAKGLTGAATAAHIHVGKAGVAGPPIFTFAIISGTATSGTVAKGSIDLSKPVMAGVSGDSLKTLLDNGNAYVNVHTAAHPGGEIRGQIKAK